MKKLKHRDLPDDPRGSWTPAKGPGGPAWADHVPEPFQFDDRPALPAGWMVWDETDGYKSIDELSFQKDYELETLSGEDVNPGEADSFGLG